ncbi:MAG: hypothetical protein P1U56_16865 [Saprospiraceae bacterium]|nr:hypothetical protein [Saprospiraceae bacterium]
MNSFISRLLFLFLLFFAGCSGDPCKNVFCGQGTCVEGTCDCPEGYVGEGCTGLVNEPYFGTFEIIQQECVQATSVGIDAFRITHKTGGTPFEVSIEFIGDNSINLDGTLQDGEIYAYLVDSGLEIYVRGDFVDVDRLECVFDLSKFITCDFVLLRS